MSFFKKVRRSWTANLGGSRRKRLFCQAPGDVVNREKKGTSGVWYWESTCWILLSLPGKDKGQKKDGKKKGVEWLGIITSVEKGVPPRSKGENSKKKETERTLFSRQDTASKEGKTFVVLVSGGPTYKAEGHLQVPLCENKKEAAGNRGTSGA